MDMQLKKGLLDVLVLSTLLKEDSYGYRIIRDLAPVSEISESTLYPILKRLEAAKLLNVRTAEHNGRLRKYYSITKAGKTRIDEFLSEWQDVMKVYRFIESERRNSESAPHDTR